MKRIVRIINPYGKEIDAKEGSIAIKGSELKEWAQSIVLKRIAEARLKSGIKPLRR